MSIDYIQPSSGLKGAFCYGNGPLTYEQGRDGYCELLRRARDAVEGLGMAFDKMPELQKKPKPDEVKVLLQDTNVIQFFRAFQCLSKSLDEIGYMRLEYFNLLRHEGQQSEIRFCEQEIANYEAHKASFAKKCKDRYGFSGNFILGYQDVPEVVGLPADWCRAASAQSISLEHPSSLEQANIENVAVNGVNVVPLGKLAM